MAWWRSDLLVTQSGNVSAWGDSSGVGDANRNAAQGTGANQPIYNATDANFSNNPSLTFEANDKLITGTWSAAIAQACTVFLCARQDAAVAGRYAFDSLADPPQFALFGDGAYASHQYAGTDNSVANSAGTHVWILEYNGASSKQFIDSTTATVTGDASTNGATGISIGNYASGTANGGWTIAELGVYSSILSAGNRALLTNYLGTRYGVTIT